MVKKFSKEKHAEDAVKDFEFYKRMKDHAFACPCYKTGIPCHKMENLNCFLCYCPEYDDTKKEGGCKRNSLKGKWYFDKKLPKGKIWDCSDCVYPHSAKTAKKYFLRIYKESK